MGLVLLRAQPLLSTYNKSEDSVAITVKRPKTTTTTVQAFGSEDGFSTARTEFSTEEEVAVSGEVISEDKADLSVGFVNIYFNGVNIGTANLSYNPTTGSNLYTFSLGFLAEGIHNVLVEFPRQKL